MIKHVGNYLLFLILLMLACSGVTNVEHVITNITMGFTKYLVERESGLLEEYDWRLLARTREDTGIEVQSMTIASPNGRSFTVMRSDKEAIDEIDPELDIEIMGLRIGRLMKVCGHSVLLLTQNSDCMAMGSIHLQHNTKTART